MSKNAKNLSDSDSIGKIDVMHCQISIFELKMMVKIGVIFMTFSNPTYHFRVVKATNSKLLGTKILEIFDFFEYLT